MAQINYIKYYVIGFIW